MGILIWITGAKMKRFPLCHWLVMIHRKERVVVARTPGHAVRLAVRELSWDCPAIVSRDGWWDDVSCEYLGRA